MENNTVLESSRQFIEAIIDWQNALPLIQLDDVMLSPERVAILSMDMINGFCKFGALASPRVEALIPHIRGLFEAAWSRGVRHILLTQDTHEPDAIEFQSYAPHCVRGTPEAETVDELKSLPFFDQVIVYEKNSISSNINTGLNAWIESHPEVDTFLLVGNCTDICVYQSALFLRLQANELHLQRRVIVPQDCVDTYDLPVETARKINTFPHDADLLHAIFLYHMALNGVEVIRSFAY